MNITQEKIDDLNSVIRVKLQPEDYKEKYESSLKNYSKRVSIKGFRPGHVPMSMVKKMYGKAILAEEVNKILNDSLYGFITENKLEVLGNPLPKDEDKIDLNEGADMEFAYEIGLAPSFELKLPKEKVAYHTVKVEASVIEDQLDQVRRRYGKLTDAETTAEGDMLMGTFVELDEAGAIKEGGIMHNSTISIEYLKDDETKNNLVGKLKGDKVIVDPRKVSSGGSDMASMLGIDASKVDEINSNFQFTINEIKRIEKAEMNQEFFDKIFGEGNVGSEEDFKKRIEEDIQKNYSFDADRLFLRSITESLLDINDFSLPDSFLKRWIIATNEKPISNEQLDHEYPSYSRGLKWQLIENKIIRDNDIKVSHEELVDYVKGYLASQYARYGLAAPADEELTQGANRILSNQEETKKIYDELYNRKVLAWLKEAVSLDLKELSQDDFVKEFYGNHEHHDHDHDHDHDHEHEHHHHH